MTITHAQIEQDFTETIHIGSNALLPAAPVVTVFMLAYNHGPYIAQAIESVVAQQTNFPFVLLIADDCSTDDTRRVAEDYQRRFPAIIRIVTGPRNIGGKRNTLRAMAHVRGDYVAYCEGDDWWTDDGKLQRQFELLESNPAIVLSFHAARYFDQRTGRFGAKIGFGRRARFIGIQDAILRNGGNVATCTFFIRRSAYPTREDWFLNCPVGDYPLKIWLASRGACHYDPRPMSAYRVGVNTSWSGRQRSLEEMWLVRRAIIDMLIAMQQRLGQPSANPILLKEVSRHVMDVCLQTEKENFARLDSADRYQQYLRPLDKIMISVGRRLGISGQIGKCLARYTRFKTFIRFLI